MKTSLISTTQTMNVIVRTWHCTRSVISVTSYDVYKQVNCFWGAGKNQLLGKMRVLRKLNISQLRCMLALSVMNT